MGVSKSAAQSRISDTAGAAGGLEFTARVTPTNGHAEPARQMSFYLLRKSLADIRVEAEQTAPAPSMDQFIDGLNVSPELKAWMKKNHTVDLMGKDFTKHLTSDDVMGVPEFLEAYKNINGASLDAGVPDNKLKAADRKKNPEKYDRAVQQYQLAMHHYIDANPDTLEALDAELGDKNPARLWAKVRADQRRESDRRTLELAQTRYLAAKTDSDLEGRGTLTGIAPGNYWITTLDTPALAGDIRLRWDRPVAIRAGEISRIELSNVNAVETVERAAQ
ncbi:MAG TPA: hypothetical protein VGG55_03535 [Candidatus Acidoferrales bacterium]